MSDKEFEKFEEIAGLIHQPKSKSQRAKEIGAGLIVTTAGVAGMVYCGSKLNKHAKRPRIQTKKNEGEGYDMIIDDKGNPDAHMGKEIASAIGFIASGVVVALGVGKTAEAVTETHNVYTKSEWEERKNKSSKKAG